MPKINIDGWKCCRCGYEWVSKKQEDFTHPDYKGKLMVDVKPITCPNPKCRSPYWDIPKKEVTNV